MYIEQLNKSKNKLWSYLPLPLGFILLMLSNFLLSDGVDTNEIINQYIKVLAK